MNVKTLIAELLRLDPELPVCIGCPAHDRARRTLAPEIECVSIASVSYSSYFELDCVVDDVDTDDVKPRKVVLLQEG